jgi:hypothetical protein
MALATDLMGFGMPAQLANRMATAGNGAVTISSAGSGFSTATRIQCTQFLVSCSDTDGTKALALPVVGGDNGALIGDDFIVNNAGTTSLNLFSSTGVVISVGGVNTSKTTIALHTTMTLYPISTTQWVGVKGA